MGETFAYMQIKTIWSILLRNFDFELVGKLPEPDYEGMAGGSRKTSTRPTFNPLLLLLLASVCACTLG
jgi:sterol 14-demethylase